jgi:hypothetical protein
MTSHLHSLLIVASTSIGFAARAGAEDGITFFETKIRPVLVEHCYKCHSDRAKSPKGGLRVDSREALIRGGTSGPAIVPGEPAKSLLMRAIGHEDDVAEMPPDERLPDRVVGDFKSWIASGAPAPRIETAGVENSRFVYETKDPDSWAFRPPVRPGVPAVRDTTWARDDGDFFILARLEARGLHPARDADRHTWLRRVSFDLIGLPPSPGEIDAFVSDTSPLARERVVDRLLASPAFGERWARHWLDLVGYADQIGTANDIFAEHAWRYRDYVIAAFNADKPFDRFIREQLAGDLLPAGRVEERASNLVATGFLLLGDLPVVEADKAQLRVDVIDQQVDKVGRAFLGMSLGCARCHDHKFDPISQRDYYAMASIFHGTASIKRAEWGVWSWPTTVELPETTGEQGERNSRLKVHGERIAAMKAERERANRRIAEIRAILDSKPAAMAGTAPPPRDSLEKERRELEARKDRLGRDIEHAEFFTPKVPVAFAVHEAVRPAPMRITIRGKAHALGDEVARGFVKAISRGRAESIPAEESGRRQMADWIASAENPLTARVAVNRIWQRLFGEGIVRSVDYFGRRGERPSHPELLDFLATRFVADGWSQKRLIRRLVLSRTYGMSSDHDERAREVDPDNNLVWRMNRRRLDAEAFRDATLAVSGELSAVRGGPGIPLEYPENTGGLKKGEVNPPFFHLRKFRPEQSFVRTVYLPIIRSGPQAGPGEVRNVFDFTQPGEFAGRRIVTTVPTQALYLMNSGDLKQRAFALARRVLAEKDDGARPDRLWLRVLNRPITAEERAESAAFVAGLRGLNSTAEPASRELSAWAELCHALLASNEFLVRL